MKKIIFLYLSVPLFLVFLVLLRCGMFFQPQDRYISMDLFIRAYQLDNIYYGLYHTDIKNRGIDDDLLVRGIFKNRIFNIAWNKEYIYGQTSDDEKNGTVTRVSIHQPEYIEYGLPYSFITKNNLTLKPLDQAYEEISGQEYDAYRVRLIWENIRKNWGVD